MSSASRGSAQWDGYGGVTLVDVMAAADRGLAPLGPEFAGFVALEAAQRIRGVGGGVVTPSELAIDGAGQVHLVAPPRRADEAASAEAIRALLRALLEVATTSTPALRRCGRRSETTTIAALCREIFGALIPLNREASRRGVARVAKATADAIAAGMLARKPLAQTEPSPEPVVVEKKKPVVAARPAPPVVEPPPSPPAPAVDLATKVDAPVATIEREDTTPVEPAPAWMDPNVATIKPPNTFEAIAPTLEDEPIEIVSDLPPITVEPTPPHLKTSSVAPMHVPVPPVARAEKLASIEVEARAVDDVPPPRGRSRGVLRAFLWTATLVAVGFGVSRPAVTKLLRGAFAPSAPPPGDTPPAAASSVIKPTKAAKEAPIDAEHATPATCAASLAIENAPSGAEVFRKLGAAPLTASVPTHVPLDLVGVIDGWRPDRADLPAPRRVHVDPSASWRDTTTGPRLEVSLVFDAPSAGAWPAATSAPTPLASEPFAARGLLRVLANPAGASVWIAVAPSSIGDVPCGAPVDLLVVSPNVSMRTLHVEWSAFAGAPPRAVAKM